LVDSLPASSSRAAARARRRARETRDLKYRDRRPRAIVVSRARDAIEEDVDRVVGRHSSS